MGRHITDLMPVLGRACLLVLKTKVVYIPMNSLTVSAALVSFGSQLVKNRQIDNLIRAD